MKKAFFFHTRISGGSMPMNADGQRNVSVRREDGQAQFVEQMALIVSSGLYENCHALIIGVNAAVGSEDAQFVSDNAPAGATLVFHGEEAESLLPTMRLLQDWIKGHEDWAVGFAHAKSVTHRHDPMRQAWRRCLEHHVIEHWQKCVNHIERGFDAVGCHWIQGEGFGVPKVFFGGVFWWSTAKFLLTLPKLKEKVEDRADWYRPEFLIGEGPRLPIVKDFHPAWPSLTGCQQSSIT
jgi:hypothetical protein